MKETLLERFIRYVKINTRSDINSKTIPTTQGQVDFLKMLAGELIELGFEEVEYDPEDAFLRAKLSSNLEQGQSVDSIGFIAHVDTADYNSEDINPIVHPDYDGKDILLNKEKDMTLSVKEFPNLANYLHQTVITTDGTTLLGADDKAGLVSIIHAGIHLIENPDISHGDIFFAFGPDEEIGLGAHRFKAEKFPAKFAYTLDSGTAGRIEYETFNAARAQLTFKGASVHPGTAKGLMVNALAESAKFFARLPQDQVPEKTSGYQGFFMLSKQSGDINQVEATYIIRDHSKEEFEARKAHFQELVKQQNKTYDYPRIDCHMYDEYYNMYEILKNDMQPVEIALEAYQNLGIEPKVEPFRGGTDGCIITYKGIPTPNLFTGAENLHGPYEFVSLESMEKARDVVLEIINLVAEVKN